MVSKSVIMPLRKEILRLLNEEEEPLKKRLKIANYAFSSEDVYLQSKEVYLFEWITSISSTNTDAWKIFDHWLNSMYFRKLNKTDLPHHCIALIYKAVYDNMNSEDIERRELAVNTSLSLINNPIFQEYFKLNLKKYFHFLCRLLVILKESNILELLNSDNIFGKNYNSVNKFYKHFFELLLPTLSHVSSTFDDPKVFGAMCLLVQKHTLRKNFKPLNESLQHYFEENSNKDHPIFAYLFKSLNRVYNASTEKCAAFLKLFLTSVCNEFPSSTVFVYKLCLVFFQELGFNVSIISNKHPTKTKHYDHDKSLQITASIFAVLTTFKNDLSLKIHDIEFSQFIQAFIYTFINVTATPHKCCLQILYYCADIDPLLIDNMVTVILNYVLLKNHNCEKEYRQLFLTIFKVFEKLHRVHTLISKILVLLKQETEMPTTNIIEFNRILPEQVAMYEYNIEKVFPSDILQCFVNCVTRLASWQVINIFKTFIFHLESSIAGNLQDKRNLAYIEATALFLCNFLCSVRILEHTVPDLVVKKFVSVLEELKLFLHKFGNILINMQHDHILMKTLLHICYAWGDVCMILSHYSRDININLKDNENFNNTLADLSYFHPYLTADQWSLISERVNNFGKTECKQLMQSLRVQHIKTALLLENILNDNMITTFINNVVLSLNDLWHFIIEDRFTLESIILRMSCSQILTLSDAVVEHTVDQNDISNFKKVLNSEVMIKFVLYTILLRINRLLKLNKSSQGLLLSTRIFKELQKVFLKDNEAHDLLNQIVLVLNAEEHHYNTVGIDLKINHERLSQYLSLLLQMPIVYLPEDHRLSTALYFLGVINDLRNLDQSNLSNVESLETLLTGMLQGGSKYSCMTLEPSRAVSYLVNNLKNYKKTFYYYLEIVYLQDDPVEQLEHISEYLLKYIINNKKYERCLAILLCSMTKHKKRKIIPECKNNIVSAIEKVSKNITELIVSKRVHSLSLYALVLNINLIYNESAIQNLKDFLPEYIDIALNNTSEEFCHEEAILLLSTVLRNISKFEMVKDDFILNIWKAYKNVHVPEQIANEKKKLLVLIFEGIGNDNFEYLAEDLLTQTVHLKDDHTSFIDYIDVWTNILSCNFNPIRNRVWMITIETFLQKLIVLLAQSNTCSVWKRIIEFEIQLCQTIHVQLTPSMLNTIFITTSRCTSEHPLELHTACIHLLDILLRYRKPLMTDRLPTFLQQYRNLLEILCKKSTNRDKNMQDLEKSAHCLEMLTKNLICYDRHVARITPYLIADILTKFETLTLIPEIKMYLENCVYSLLQLCDQHSISYLMRTLSVASTELFKSLYENYNKFYRYKGKV